MDSGNRDPWIGSASIFALIFLASCLFSFAFYCSIFFAQKSFASEWPLCQSWVFEPFGR